MAGREQAEKQRIANQELPPRPSSDHERTVTKSESEKQTEIDNELAVVESITDRLRDSYRSKLPEVKSAFSKEQRIQLTELFNQKADLVSAMENKDTDTLTAAEAKLDIYYKIMSIVDDVSRKAQGKKEGLMHSRSVPVEKKAMYNPDSDDQVEEVVEEEPVDEQNELTEAWDAQVGQWISWAVENDMYNTDTGEKPWDSSLTNEDLLQKTGLNQGQLSGLTSAMVRQKQQNEHGSEQAA